MLRNLKLTRNSTDFLEPKNNNSQFKSRVSKVKKNKFKRRIITIVPFDCKYDDVPDKIDESF